MVNLGDKDRDMSTCTYIMIRLNMQALITCRLYWVMFMELQYFPAFDSMQLDYDKSFIIYFYTGVNL